MAWLAQSLVSLLATASVATAGAYNPVIEKDVVIVGGGGSGAHAAFRLREDFGKSIILIEKEAILVRSWLMNIHVSLINNLREAMSTLTSTVRARPTTTAFSPSLMSTVLLTL